MVLLIIVKLVYIICMILDLLRRHNWANDDFAFLKELNNYLMTTTSTSVIVDNSRDGDHLRINFNVRYGIVYLSSNLYLLPVLKISIPTVVIFKIEVTNI